MGCESIKKAMEDFLNGEDGAGEQSKLWEHLKECPACRRYLDALVEADGVLRRAVREALNSVEPPPYLAQKITGALESGRGRALKRRAAFLLKAAAAAAVIFLAFFAAGQFGFFRDGFPGLVSSSRQEDTFLDAFREVEELSHSALNDSGSTADGVGRAEISPAPQEETNAGEADLPAAVRVPSPAVGAAGATQAKESPAAAIPPGQVRALSKESRGRENKEPPLSSPPGAAAGTAWEGRVPVVPHNSGLFVAADSEPAADPFRVAAAAAGFEPLVPSYLPPGSGLVELKWEKGAITQSYRAGNSWFTVTQARAAGKSDGGLPPEPLVFDGQTGGPAARWRVAGFEFCVQGNLPAEEILKIARSLGLPAQAGP